MAGLGAPPRANGELVFAEPWESRAFGMGLALYEAGQFEWDEFRDELIASIKQWELEHPDGASYSYYACWLDALQKVMDAHGTVTAVEVDDRVHQFAARPAGHDHGHDHDHDDHHHDHHADHTH